ncbi:hypothetical protein GW17_00034366 [Ensete ventricosum]|nr:hypothetical protein GW17_00034366 [Ensete ventricosum]
MGVCILSAEHKTEVGKRTTNRLSIIVCQCRRTGLSEAAPINAITADKLNTFRIPRSYIATPKRNPENTDQKVENFQINPRERCKIEGSRRQRSELTWWKEGSGKFQIRRSCSWPRTEVNGVRAAEAVVPSSAVAAEVRLARVVRGWIMFGFGILRRCIGWI